MKSIPWPKVSAVLSMIGALCALGVKVLTTKQIPSVDDLAALGGLFTAGWSALKAHSA